MKSYVVR